MALAIGRAALLVNDRALTAGAVASHPWCVPVFADRSTRELCNGGAETKSASPAPMLGAQNAYLQRQSKASWGYGQTQHHPRVDTSPWQSDVAEPRVRVCQHVAMRDHADLPVVAVVDASEKAFSVWHVDVGAREAVTGSRLVGAWVLMREQFSELESVLARRIWFTSDAGAEAAAALALKPFEGFLAPGDTVQAVQDVRSQLLEAFEAEQARRDRTKQLVELSLPEAPPVPAHWEPVATAPPAVGVALAMARWLEELASVWSSMEGQRRARPFLLELGGTEARDLPMCVR